MLPFDEAIRFVRLFYQAQLIQESSSLPLFDCAIRSERDDVFIRIFVVSVSSRKAPFERRNLKHIQQITYRPLYLFSLETLSFKST